MTLFRQTGRRPLARDSRGNVLIITGLAMPIVVGAMGLGVDYAQWVSWRRGLQGAADSAALAGARSRAAGANLAMVEAEAGKVIESNTVVELSETDINLIASPGQGAGALPNSVEVILEAEGHHHFAGLFMDTPPTIRTRAVAGPRGFGRHCFLALDTTAAAAIDIKDGTVTANCGLVANSNHAQAVYVEGNGRLNATSATAVGDTAREGNGSYGSTSRSGGVQRQIDPFGPEGRNIQVPSTSPTGSIPWVKDGTSTVSAPSGCIPIPNGGEYKIDGNTTVNFSPGVYTFCGRGKLNIDGNVRLNGNGVSFVVTGGGWLEINGNPQIDLKAMTTTQAESLYGANDPRRGLAGVLFWQTQASNPSDKNNFISGNASLKLNGAFYTPHQKLEIHGNMHASSTCVQLVAKTLYLGGNSNIPNTCPVNDPNFGSFDTNEIALTA